MKKIAAVGGIVGPLLFGSILITLTILKYDFLRSLGWDPIQAPTFDWPSGLALGRYGIWMTLTFIVSGSLMMLFALGLRITLEERRAPRIGTLGLLLAGCALAGLAFTTDPTIRTTPATWHGRLHDLSFVLLGLTLLPSMLVLGFAFRENSPWKNLSSYTWITAALAIPTFALKGIFFYVFLVAILAWSEVAAIRLFQDV